MKFTAVTIVVVAALVGQSQAAKFATGCKRFHEVSNSDSCAGVAAQYGITTDELFLWNGGLHKTCDNLDNGSLVCVSLTGPATTDLASPGAATSATANSAAPSASTPSVAASTSSASSPASAASSPASAASSPAPAASSPASAASARTSASASASASASVTPSAGIRQSVSVALLLASVAAAAVFV
ncbi:hypothetical protein BC938DRAFT_475703, partial [Jimgerdemannia flammicorona]